MTKKERERIMALPRSERLALMLELWETLEDRAKEQFGLRAEDEEELCRRADDIDSHPERFVSGAVAERWMRNLKRRMRAARRKAS